MLLVLLVKVATWATWKVVLVKAGLQGRQEERCLGRSQGKREAPRQTHMRWLPG